ncbi:hypothetical protein BGZ81_011232 [Podila clonocystis]|nr:hypothetical protein BGZ81_011232 [Podila clonocystis]
MATYKQRPYSRQVGSGRHSPDIASPKITQTPVHHHAYSSLAHTTPSQSQSQSHSHSHGLSHPDDEILDNTSDHEWTSIRHTISARAKARQEQYYRNQEQQRAQEWHFVLGQHQKASASASARIITRKNKDTHSSDEYEDPPIASPIVSVSTYQEDQHIPIRFETDLEGDSSHFGFSDLASDLDGLDESEEQGWSHDDDEAVPSSSTSICDFTKHQDRHQQKPFSSPYSNVSATSLSNLTHPSFALGHHDNQGVGFHLQNKMPLHDGSGNFATVLSGDSDQGGWDSSTSASKPHRQRYHGQVTLQSCSIYESEMEDIEGMVIDIPSKVGWLQIFEQALSVFNNSHDMDSLNPIKALAQSPFVDDLDSNANIGVSKGSTTTLPVSSHNVTDDTTGDGEKDMATSSFSGSKENRNATTPITSPSMPIPLSGSTPSTVKSLSNQVRMKHLRQKMSASSLDALQRLQKRQRSDMAFSSSLLASPHISKDPMHVDFMPTVVDSLSEASSTSLGRQTPTRSASTMTGSSYYSSERDTNMLTTMISTLRRFRDHVKSNLLHPEFDQENNYLSGLGFEGDLGMEWAIGTSSSSSTSGEDASKGETSPVIVIENMDTNKDASKSKGRFFGRALPSGFSSGASTPTLSTTATRTPSRVSSSTNVRRIGSECGLESLSLRHEDWSKGRGERIHRYSHRYDECRPSLVD